MPFLPSIEGDEEGEGGRRGEEGSTYVHENDALSDR